MWPPNCRLPVKILGGHPVLGFWWSYAANNMESAPPARPVFLGKFIGGSPLYSGEGSSAGWLAKPIKHEAFHLAFVLFSPHCPAAHSWGWRGLAPQPYACEPSGPGRRDSRVGDLGTGGGSARCARRSAHPRSISCGRSFRSRICHGARSPLANGLEPPECRGEAFRSLWRSQSAP